MTVASKAAGLSLFFLGLLARQATAADFVTCDTLRTAVEAAITATSFTIDADFECTSPITISGGLVTIEGGDKTITISSTFLAPTGTTGAGLFTVEAGGSLELNDVTITSTEVESDGIRGIYNEGTLSVNNCVFSKLNTNVGDSNAFVARGAAVSCHGVLRYSSSCCCGVWCVLPSGLT